MSTATLAMQTPGGRPETTGNRMATAIGLVRSLAALAYSLSRLLWPTVLLALILLILANLGKYFSSRPDPTIARSVRIIPIPDSEQRALFDKALATALKEARGSTE